MNIYGFIDGNFWLKKQDIYVEKYKDIYVEKNKDIFWPQKEVQRNP